MNKYIKMLFFLFVSFFLVFSSCTTNLDHVNKYDPSSDPEIQKKSTIFGNVILEGETDFSNVGVQLIGRFTYSVLTDSYGRFTVGGIVPGTYKLQISEKYFKSVTKEIVIGVDEVYNIGEIYLLSNKFSVYGKIYLQGDVTLSPEGTMIILERTGTVKSKNVVANLVPLSYENGSTVPVLISIADYNGKFSVKNLLPGYYRITIRRENFLPRQINLFVGNENLVIKDLGEIYLYEITGNFKIKGFLLDEANSPTVENYYYTATESVQLELYGFNASEMKVGNFENGICQYEDWSLFRAKINWFLSKGDGIKSVCVKFREKSGDETEDLMGKIILDTVTPAIFKFGYIDNGFFNNEDGIFYYRGNSQIPIESIITDSQSGIYQMKFSINNSYSVWQSYQQYYSLTLTEDGSYNIEGCFRDYAYNVTCGSLNFVKDVLAPVGNAPLVNNMSVSGKTNLSVITLSYNSFASDTKWILISNSPSFDSAYKIPATTSVNWYLTQGDGLKEIYTKFEDKAGNISDLYVTMITLDTTPPSVPEIWRTGFYSNKITIAWSNSSANDISFYELQKKVPELMNEFVNVGRFPNNITKYTDSEIISGYRHFYRIRAVDELGNASQWSVPFDAGLPIKMMNSSLYINTLSDSKLLWRIPKGALTLLGNYSYQNITGTTFTGNIYANSTVSSLPSIGNPLNISYNGNLNFQIYNPDGDMVLNNNFKLVDIKEIINIPYVNKDYLKMVSDKDGNLHIIFKDVSGTDSSLIYGSNVLGVWQFETVDYGVDTGNFCQFVVDASGHAHIVYISFESAGGGNYSAKLKYATNKNGYWEIDLVDSENSTYQRWNKYLSVDIDEVGGIHISYENTFSHILKYAYKDNTDWNISTVDNNGGSFNSIVSGTDGLVRISYFDESNKVLKYAIGNKNGFQIDKVDISSSNVGKFTSIVRDDNNKVYISYFDDADNKLKYADNITGEWHIETVLDNYSVIDETAIILNGNREPYILSRNNLGLYLSIYDNNRWKSYNLNINCNSISFFNREYMIDVSCKQPYSSVTVINYLSLSYNFWRKKLLKQTNLNMFDFIIRNDIDNNIHIIYKTEYTSDDLYYVTNNGGYWETSIIESSSSYINIDNQSFYLGADSIPNLIYYDYGQNKLILADYDKDLNLWEKTDVVIGEEALKPSLIISEPYSYISYIHKIDNSNKFIRFLSEIGDSPKYIDGKEIAEDMKMFKVDDKKIVIIYSDSKIGAIKSWDNISNKVEILDTGFYAGKFSVDMDSKGYLHFAFYDSSLQALIYVSNLSGNWETEIVDIDGNTGNNPNLKVDKNGNVHILYYFINTSGARELRYATNFTGRWKHFVLKNGEFNYDFVIDHSGNLQTVLYEYPKLFQVGFGLNITNSGVEQLE